MTAPIKQLLAQWAAYRLGKQPLTPQKYFWTTFPIIITIKAAGSMPLSH